jgi:hypothetical protein
MKKLKPYNKNDEAGDSVKAQQEKNLRTVVPIQFPQGDCAHANRHAAHGSCWSGAHSALQSQKEVVGQQTNKLRLQVQVRETMRGNNVKETP